MISPDNDNDNNNNNNTNNTNNDNDIVSITGSSKLFPGTHTVSETDQVIGNILMCVYIIQYYINSGLYYIVLIYIYSI